jgi:hypothetical protein
VKPDLSNWYGRGSEETLSLVDFKWFELNQFNRDCKLITLVFTDFCLGHFKGRLAVFAWRDPNPLSLDILRLSSLLQNKKRNFLIPFSSTFRGKRSLWIAPKFLFKIFLNFMNLKNWMLRYETDKNVLMKWHLKNNCDNESLRDTMRRLFWRRYSICYKKSLWQQVINIIFVVFLEYFPTDVLEQ